jgi:glycosyltransferase involved in cell wall biosynthesis
MTSTDSSPVAASVRVFAWLRSQAWLRGAYHLLPAGLREGALRLFSRRLQARTRFVRTAAWEKPLQPAGEVVVRAAGSGADQPGVNILGYIHGQFGLAEAARSYARALIEQGVPVALRDIDLGLPNARGEHALDAYLDDAMPHAVSIIFVNPDYLAQALASIQLARGRGRYLIACWFWELERLPDSWLPALELVDEVMVATGFVGNAVAHATRKPVTRIPMPLGVLHDSGLQRVDFGLPEDAFVFLTSFDFSSRMERKNPEAVIRAFREAFPAQRRDVRLLVKSSNGHRFPHLLKHLLAIAGGDERIIIRDEVIAREHLNALQRCCDAYVSLHRAEGFGLGLAECMAMGKPVIATGWSGNMEFMDADSAGLVDFTLVPVREGDYPAGKGQRWADAHLPVAAAWMRRLADDRAFAAALGQAGRGRVEAILSPQAAASGIIERVRQLQANTRTAQDTMQTMKHEAGNE